MFHRFQTAVSRARLQRIGNMLGHRVAVGYGCFGDSRQATLRVLGIRVAEFAFGQQYRPDAQLHGLQGSA